MSEFFAMLRGVEKRFGTVRDFRLVRDADVSTAYQSFFMVEFADDATVDQIPAKGTNLKVEIPIIRNKPGGIGLTDLNGLLQQQERDWTLDTSGLYGATVPVLPPADGEEKLQTRIVELVVQHAKKETRNLYERPLTRYHMSFGAAFYRWGGFYQPSSSDDKPVPPRMEWVLSRWKERAQEDEQRRERQQPRLQPQPMEAPDVAVDAHEAETSVAQEAAHVQPAETSALQPETHAEQVPQRRLEPLAPVEADHLATPSLEATEPVPKSTPATPRLSRKQKILALAREHARTPPPDAAKRDEEEEARRREEEAREPPDAEVSTMRERLLKLMGRWS
ncbi:hypothetical protein L227DRAFT_577948 [Lentinus tigrinus ALCF2SS1-6]|uniref:Uncharacterized protein n=2 Tax=Lentinus tigrinus TaxID=5365 RepID=A0A5C2S1R4_9APHY|nr:hypothetical protein L227DRAFT_577948 [Lentinus tigrinus ALCF2SS1-6]